mgnify:CR=1 FL=1
MEEMKFYTEFLFHPPKIGILTNSPKFSNWALFCLSGKTETIKKVLQYVDIVGLVSFLSPFGFVLMWSAWDSPYRVTTLIFKTLYFLLQAYPMIYPTNLLRAFAVVCSWRILETKINLFFWFTKSIILNSIIFNEFSLYFPIRIS